MVRIPLSPSRPHFSLNTSGVAGIFGGDEAVSAMATVHLYKGRRWLGWYNCPGSYHIAKRYGLLAKSGFFEGFFPGARTDPAMLFDLDGRKGPKFRAVYSGTIIEETGHLAALLMQECIALEGTVVFGRTTQPVGVTIATLDHVPELQMHPTRIRVYTPICAIIPITVSLGACVACGVFGDWYSFSLILLGILTSGIACLVIGSGKFMFEHPEPAEGSPQGDGILSSGGQIILLKGEEGAVNSVTRGRFYLKFPNEPKYSDIGGCSLLLIVQFIAQLLLVPQGSLFGQIMFVGSLAVSWAYNWWLSSLNKESIQRNILLKQVLRGPTLEKYILGTRTTMVVFVLLVLHPEDPEDVLKAFLPNNTKVWKRWKKTIVERLSQEKFEFVDSEDWESLTDFTPEEKTLLETLYRDAEAAYDGYVQYVTPN